MNKSIIYFILLAVMTFIACDPVSDSESVGGAITAEQLEISATPIVINGVNTNKVILTNHSPVLSNWDYGIGVSTAQTDTVLLVLEGQNTITFTGLNANGTTISKQLTVTVDDLYFDVPEEWALFCGAGEKTWVWDSSNCWGNGGYLVNQAPAWWVLSPGPDLDGQVEGEGTTNANMVFSIQGASLTKNLDDGSQLKGSFSFDMSKITYATNGNVWAIGKLKTNGVTVLVGVSPDEGKAPVYEYDIISLDEETMILSYTPPGGAEWSTSYYWVFKAK